jgi:hypothetical protein
MEDANHRLLLGAERCHRAIADGRLLAVVELGHVHRGGAVEPISVLGACLLLGVLYMGSGMSLLKSWPGA